MSSSSVSRFCLRPSLILILRPFFFGAEPGFFPRPRGVPFLERFRRLLGGLEGGVRFFTGGGAFLAFGGGGGGGLAASFGLGGGGAFLAFGGDGGGGGGAFLAFGGGGGGGGGGGVFAMANASCKHRVPLKKSGGCWDNHAGNSINA